MKDEGEKMKKRILSLILAMIIIISAVPQIVYAAEAPSGWAQEQVRTAITENLVPQNLQSNYTQAITRAEFCALAVALYESTMGVISGRTTFLDTNDVNVQKLAFLGVVSGVGDNRFESH